MGSKSSPKPPDPYQTANAQAQANKDAIITSARINRYNTETPWGSVSWEKPQEPSYSSPTPYAPSGASGIPGRPSFDMGFGGGTSNYGVGDPASSLEGWTQKISLSDPMQQQFDQSNDRALALGDLAMNRIGQIDTNRLDLSGLPPMVTGGISGGTRIGAQDRPDVVSNVDLGGLPELNKDYSADADKVEKATYDRLMMLMNPQFQERQRELDNRLAVMGLPVGGEAYGGEKDRYDRMRNEAELAAALESVGAGRAEQSRLFGIDSTARGQLVGERFGNANLNNDSRQQLFNESATLNSQRLANSAQGLQAQLANAQLGNQARQQMLSERMLERSQPMNELAQLLGGIPGLQTPQAPNVAQYQAAAPDIGGMIQSNYNTQANQHAAKKGGTSGLLGTLGGAAVGSDWFGELF